MDRALVISSLRAPERHVANDAIEITKQYNLISKLERAGDDTTSAVALLRSLELTQAQHIADRERLRAELAALDAAEVASADASIATSRSDSPLRHRRRVRRTPYRRW